MVARTDERTLPVNYPKIIYEDFMNYEYECMNYNQPTILLCVKVRNIPN